MSWRRHVDRAVEVVGDVIDWFVDDLDSRKARELVEHAPLSAAQSWLVVLIQLAFHAIEVVMAVLALAMAPGIIGLCVITFGANVVVILVAAGISPAAWFVVRRPRAELKALLLRGVAARAHAMHRARTPGAIGSSSCSSLAVPTLPAHDRTDER